VNFFLRSSSRTFLKPSRGGANGLLLPLQHPYAERSGATMDAKYRT
jgi:hypothetical protein